MRVFTTAQLNLEWLHFEGSPITRGSQLPTAHPVGRDKTTGE